MANPTLSPQQLLEQMNQLDQSACHGDEKLRADLLSSARALCLRLENPWDTILRMIYVEVGKYTSPASVKTKLNAASLPFCCLSSLHWT